jgi:hypothetical protein
VQQAAAQMHNPARPLQRSVCTSGFGATILILYWNNNRRYSSPSRFRSQKDNEILENSPMMHYINPEIPLPLALYRQEAHFYAQCVFIFELP